MSSPLDDGLAPQEYINGILGPILSGSSANLFLFGTLLNVFVVYYQSELYSRDPIYARVVMWVTVSLCGANAAICVQQIYYHGVQALFTGIIAFTVQGFLIKRAGKMFHTRWYRQLFLGVMGSVALLAFVGSLLSTYEVVAYVHHYRHVVRIQIAAGIWLGASAAADVLISIALFFNLWSHIAGFNMRTDSILVRLIQVALRTAAYTAIPSLTGAVLSLALPYDDLKTLDVPVAFWLPLSPLYGLSIFTTLGIRSKLEARPLTPLSIHVPMSTASRTEGIISRPSEPSHRLSKALTVTSDLPI